MPPSRAARHRPVENCTVVPHAAAPRLSEARPRRAWLCSTSRWAASWALGLAAATLDADRAGERLAAAEPTGRWPFEVTAGHFRIHADFEISAKTDLLSELERLGGDVAGLLQVELPHAPVHVVIFGTADEYRRYMGHYYPNLPQRRALFIQQRGAGMLFAHRHPDLATDLRHETVHAILNDRSDPLPLWLDEGLAEYFEVPARERWSGHSHLLAIQALEGRAPAAGLESLEGLGEVALMSAEHYRDAWAWIHFLLHRRMSTRRILVQHLERLRSGEPAPPLSRTVAGQIPDWRAEICDHFQRVG
ncbi:MAG: DUF1570 domain-containing protein [Aureliella sp.]